MPGEFDGGYLIIKWKRARELARMEPQGHLIFEAPEYDYYDALDTSSCPFPTSPYYDMKAWIWMLKHF
jgi:hypothetical protein